MLKRKIWLCLVGAVLVLMLAVIPFATSCSNTTPATSTSTTQTTSTTSTTAPPQTLKVGALFGLTGFFSAFDAVQAAEAQVAVDIINSGGGIKVNGQQYNIQLITYDFESNMDGVAAGANELVFQDGVKYMIAPSAFFSPPTKDITEPNKVIRGETFITGTPQELSAGMDYTFLCHNSALEHALTNIQYIKQAYPNVKTVAFLHPDDGNQGYVFDHVKPMLDKAGISVVGDLITFANETVDFSPVASKAIALKPDMIFLANGTPLHAGDLLKAVRQAGSDIPLVYSGDAAPTDILAIAGADAGTNYFGTGIFNGAPNTPPLMQQIIDKRYAQAGGPISLHAQAINVLYMFKQAIEKANSLDTTAVKNAWESMSTMETPYGTAHQGGLETYGINHAYAHPDQVWTLVAGKPVFGAWIDIGAMP
jgi:branched-chain amino acid transport system substrate-binding protein